MLICLTICFLVQLQLVLSSSKLHRQNQLHYTGQVNVLKYRHSFFHESTRGHGRLGSLQVKDHFDVMGVPSASQRLKSFNLRVSSFTTDVDKGLASMTSAQAQTPIRLDENHQYLPNVSDKETIINLAKMTSDAYLEDPGQPNWFNTSLGFNFTDRFGWKEDGLRGHIFASEDDGMVVVSFKGTTIYPRGKLSERDRVNDVTMFSCCCGAHHPYYYAPVCGCSNGTYQCDSTCLSKAVLQNDSYYDAAIYTMEWALSSYPKSKFWVVGHSLGGSIASLVGLTYDIPAVTFEAPPERLPAQRMGLLSLNSSANIGSNFAYHIGNTADPVYMGSCWGYLSFCSAGGFSFETQCHTGQRCEYDTVKDKGWHVSITNHRIDYVIANVLEAYDSVPVCEDVKECVDCYGWQYH